VGRRKNKCYPKGGENSSAPPPHSEQREKHPQIKIHHVMYKLLENQKLACRDCGCESNYTREHYYGGELQTKGCPECYSENYQITGKKKKEKK
jgi:hypothetical protein